MTPALGIVSSLHGTGHELVVHHLGGGQACRLRRVDQAAVAFDNGMGLPRSARARKSCCTPLSCTSPSSTIGCDASLRVNERSAASSGGLLTQPASARTAMPATVLLIICPSWVSSPGWHGKPSWCVAYEHTDDPWSGHIFSNSRPS